jgi:predicted ester cyclase
MEDGAERASGAGATPEDNKEIIRRVVREGVNAHDLDVFREMLASDYARHSQATTEAPEIRGVEDMLEVLRGVFAAFPDWHEEIELMVAEGDKVACITRGRGTHTGPLGDIPPTGRRMEVTNYIFQRIENGKIAETWVGWDNLAGLIQLGLVTPPAAGGR